MENLLFFYFYWVRDMECAVGNDRTDLARSINLGPFEGQNDRKSAKFFVFEYGTWCFQSNGHMMSIIFGIWTH